MANPWLALKQTTSDALSTVSAATAGVTHLANAGAELAKTAEVNAKQYRMVTEATAAQDLTRSINRRKHELAQEDARFYLDLESRMQGNDRLRELYLDALKDYSKPSHLAVAAE